MQTTIDIPKDVLDRARWKARHDGISLSEVITRQLEHLDTLSDTTGVVSGHTDAPRAICVLRDAGLIQRLQCLPAEGTRSLSPERRRHLASKLSRGSKSASEMIIEDRI
ncbi:MAG: hypothetical protein AUJ92_17670 [Armatimonadetes bacterium CG2_30_59_28]|nr:hypothetical protein [Armatimonadota bacterium]OIO90912.1 MAG: hypothetical protein AUJ92_17670 [Armatimonadetes bacterium CG2_30_59_28]PIU64190.1 MAG: hypothetical protein COS85_13465 [Armatimonadetes bacterium CG07_land_8_20_14_0_80_59_28]PIX40906.1 MAG: hypothetical protein COZ56_13525 [Armatimonadetes bacterium CG_4_8_14_3_um_filter_58_9]PIY48098.1 MAG: hypothetical protein COZ05_04155 [Armatimonadetes bacterium CG_4_10_14_3_um_filter_59_10]PJB77971.1 MAG: hypothetical protein CO095_009